MTELDLIYNDLLLLLGYTYTEQFDEDGGGNTYKEKEWYDPEGEAVNQYPSLKELVEQIKEIVQQAREARSKTEDDT